jgi:hypothetical protein
MRVLLLALVLSVTLAGNPFLSLTHGENQYWQSATVEWNGSPMGVYTNPYNGISFTSQVQPGGIWVEREPDISFTYQPPPGPPFTPPGPPVIIKPGPPIIPPGPPPFVPGNPPRGNPGPDPPISQVPEPSGGQYFACAVIVFALVRWRYGPLTSRDSPPEWWK